ncbi:hypothetical protein CR155_07880 [Pollutimonas nitritireducens]|uniref:MmgE/PrpD family protein n=1 Tax=Pollutimonas nitritireducens TaxID=2045209 RepID=A0A2N4UI05_9BURK|nr:MmgE/PrpD family protein [Pollutimonas nitritireducens]PLC54661.1 hypothetical protein CR155_07880 [Pollutimonas nitritireducens]
MGLTLELARLVADARSQDIDDAALTAAGLGFMDTIATAFAGAHEDASQKALAFARKRSIADSGLCALPWLPDALPASLAALVFGTAAHALDFDDVALSGHPSAVLVPSILCEGLATRRSGRTCLEAYVIGYQVWAELFRREPDPLHTKGWHPTAAYGVLAASAAIAYMRQTNAHDIATTLAVAASLSSGLVSNFGTMTKPLHAGRAASLAFEANEYTSLGLTASHDALEHDSGFVNAISPEGRADRLSPILRGGAWQISRHGLCIKQYPVCYGAHRAIDGAIDLATAYDIQFEDVVRVGVGLGRSQLAMLRNNSPKTGLEAKFSIQFAIAAAMDQRSVSLSQLTDEYVTRPHIQNFYEKVDTWCIEEPDPGDPTFSRYDEVRIDLKDRQTLHSGDVLYPRGHAENPVTAESLQKKFDDCLQRFAAEEKLATGRVSRLDPDALFVKLGAMAACEDVSFLFIQ